MSSGIITIAKSLPWAWVILVCMSMQGLLFITPFTSFLPVEIGARFVGILGATIFLLFIPSIICAVLGVIGLINSWPHLILELCSAIQPEATGNNFFTTGFIDTTLRVVVPFYSPLLGETDMTHDPIFQERQTYGPDQDSDDELWIYINGVATPQSIAFQNCVMLNKLFHHKILAVHNTTNSILVDLIHCIIGKLFSGKHCLASRRVLKKTLTDALKGAHSKKKVVLIAHSQGTIVTSNALSELYKEKDPEIIRQMKDKLEVYNFANCAHKLPPAAAFKHMEHIHNKGDIVAWLGALFPFPTMWLDDHDEAMSLEGKMVCEPGLWGHMLNTHYLVEMTKGHYNSSKLASYMNFKRSGALITARKSNSPERTYAKLK